MPRHLVLAFTLLTLSLTPSLRAQEPAETPPAVREVSPGMFEIGLVRLDQKARTASFPAAINMDKGMIEYLLVGRNGPTHESLLVTDVRPQELHTAMLLLGAKSPKPAAPGAEAPPVQLTADYLKHAPKLAGDSVVMTATWKGADGAEKKAELSEWLLFSPTKKAPEKGPWLYTGSLFGADGKFLAQIEDIFAGLVTNPAALINNPRKGNDDDRLWDVNEKTVPKAETTITISIRLPEGKKAAK